MANSFQNEQELPELVTISELAENLVYRLPGCDNFMIRATIREVYREFCRETKCLTADRFVDIEDNRAEYPVCSMYGGTVNEIREVKLENILLMRNRDYRVVDGLSPTIVLEWNYVSSHQNIPEGDNPARHRVYAAESRITRNRCRKLHIKAVEIPKVNSELAPQWFIDKHGDSIVSGVLSRLCAMSGRSWTDAQVAGEERIRYENAKSEARMFKEVLPSSICVDCGMEL